MRARSARAAVLAAALCSACASLRMPGVVPMGGADAPASPRVLAVPYVAQPILLCGGAAVAMVERWWGRRGVHADDFAALVRPAEGGIRTTDLSAALRHRGWAVRDGSLTADAITTSLADSAPVIALIRVSPTRLHYVVVTGWHAGRATFHDPAIAPDITRDTATFMRQWRAAGQWGAIARPAEVAPIHATTSPSTPSPDTAAVAPPVHAALPCPPWLDRAATAAAQDPAGAQVQLDSAAARCPDEPLVTRERAGLLFRRHLLDSARVLATRYTARAPSDSLGWQLLATTRYLTQDPDGALDAWNQVGRPRLDLLVIAGAQRTRHAVFADAAELVERRPLTRTTRALAARRLGDLPTVTSATVSYQPLAGGLAEVRAALSEVPLVTPLAGLAFATGIDAVFRRDVSLSVASPLRVGDLWTLQWRWQHADPRVAVRVALPAHVGMPLVVGLERAWETYNYSAGLSSERRGDASVRMRGWVHPGVELLLNARQEQWNDSARYTAVAGGIGLHDAQDRLTLLLESERAVIVSGAEPYGRARGLVAWHPREDARHITWSARAGASWTTARTPLALQPMAGGDLARAIPLRAHPFIVDRRLPAERIARLITHAGITADHAVTRQGPLAVDAGVFVDAAHVQHPADPRDGAARLYVDAGAGLRLRLAGSQWAALRLDLARGLTTDRRWGVTAGLSPAWPDRLGRTR